MEHICYNCFRDSLDENGVCTQCGFDGAKNREKYPLALPLGSILFGRYIIGRVLGQGGFGITYLAQDFQTKGRVAIKEFFPETMAMRTEKYTVAPYSGEKGENFAYGLTKFLDEAKTMAEFIGNPNITRVDSYFEENGTGYFVMEYLEGQSLQEYIQSRGGQLSWEETMNVVFPVMNALEAMHKKGIIHRDVAPDNIYITKDGSVKLLDFGAARYSLGNVSHSLDVILKPGFAPKEQYIRRGKQGPFTDIYALGATIYYAITGTKPDESVERADEDNMPMPTTLGAKITDAQEAALMGALAVQPADRYQSIAEFRTALTTTRPKPPKPEPPKPEPPKPEPKKQLPKWLIPAAAAAMVIIGIAVLGGRNSEKTGLEVSPTSAPEQPTDYVPAPQTEAPVAAETLEPTVLAVTFPYLGGTYEGEAEGGVPHGLGTLTWEGCSYTGSFADGYPKGSGEFTVTVANRPQTIQSDAWGYTSMDYTLSVAPLWMDQIVEKSMGQYQGMVYEDSRGHTTICGWGQLTLSLGGSYCGAFVDGNPGGYGVYTHSSGESIASQWEWVIFEQSTFDSEYPQSVQYYSGMVGAGTCYGFGAMAYEEAGIYLGEFYDGDVRGGGTYIYRLYNKVPEVSGSSWGTTRSMRIDANLKGSGLTLNGKLQGYGMSMSNFKTYYIGEVEDGYRGGFGRYFSSRGLEDATQRGRYVGGLFRSKG